jgi:hypothetical protein
MNTVAVKIGTATAASALFAHVVQIGRVDPVTYTIGLWITEEFAAERSISKTFLRDNQFLNSKPNQLRAGFQFEVIHHRVFMERNSARRKVQQVSHFFHR